MENFSSNKTFLALTMVCIILFYALSLKLNGKPIITLYCNQMIGVHHHTPCVIRVLFYIICIHIDLMLFYHSLVINVLKKN